MRRIGIDIAHISRFRHFARKPKDRFLERTFSSRELKYCFSFADPASHLAGTFAAKEAVCKAFLGRYAVTEIEIVRRRNGLPEACRKRRKLPVSVSISHEKDLAVAVALR